MINLHERLSEFSYGFGVTREVQSLLEGIGLRPTPFMPNLLHEEQLGSMSASRTGGGLSSCSSSSVTSFGAFVGRRRRSPYRSWNTHSGDSSSTRRDTSSNV